jgi:hypothetical protein
MKNDTASIKKYAIELSVINRVAVMGTASIYTYINRAWIFVYCDLWNGAVQLFDALAFFVASARICISPNFLSGRLWSSEAISVHSATGQRREGKRLRVRNRL